MADVITIEATPRDKVGKGASRATRRANFIPAVVYGGNKEPVSVQIQRNIITRLLNRGGFMSQTYALSVNGKATTVLPRDLQLHPVTDAVMHIDFLRLAKGSTIIMEIPVRVSGEEECEGLARGGVINHTRHAIELHVPADSIPEYIEVSVASLGLGDAAKISHVTLPKGVTPTITDRDFTILAIVAPSALKSAGTGDDEVEGEEAEEVAAEGGEE
ncbi:MAG: 50S ribosomal protein L25/general stress protein Ctc [Kordiimonadales bacterium]|nr:MAG: 50S ribosomal protein L25/general stress protein Ctc [Kordiimonadales bacterium]